MMICDVRLIAEANYFRISRMPNTSIEYGKGKPVFVRLMSLGEKFQAKSGGFRDQREHDDDKLGMEYEVELVDKGNEVARFFTTSQHVIAAMTKSHLGQCFAIGWRARNDGTLFNVAWRVER